jgi:predicted Ser/Thr protein kinase
MSLDPTTIGRYRILGTLGQGAMGTVYLAEDPKLHRGLAIKVVRQALGDPEVLARFEREAEISAKLHHPNIITIYDVGEEPGVGPFLAMEYVDGENLADRLKQGPPPTQDAIHILIQAKHALDAAHRAGIVHRDLKPENFMISKMGQLKLMDFGISKGAGAKVTQTSDFLGTPAYAAPELLSGGQASQESDRWSFAASAFELLTGHLPFGGDSVGTIVFRIVHEPPRRPEGMSDALWAVFEKALSKSPADRHVDLKAFLMDVLAAVDLPEEARHAAEAQLEGTLGQSGAWAPHPAPAPARATESRWKWLAVIACGLLVVLAGIQVWQRWEPTRKLAITSTPEGADVFLDGTKVGRTPIKELLVKGNPRQLRLEKEDFEPLNHDLDTHEKAVSLQMKVAPFKVTVRSDPEGAEVFLDNQLRGVTPAPDLEVPGEGRHVLELRQVGYESWTQTLSRKEALPDPIRLQKVDESKPAPIKPVKKTSSKKAKAGKKEKEKEEPSKVKKFFRDMFKKD